MYYYQTAVHCDNRVRNSESTYNVFPNKLCHVFIFDNRVRTKFFCSNVQRHLLYLRVTCLNVHQSFTQVVDEFLPVFLGLLE